MANTSSTLRIATGLAVTTLVGMPLARCSGASSALPATAPAPAVAAAPATHVFGANAQPNAAAKLLFVSDNENNRILVYNAALPNSAPIRTITSGHRGRFRMSKWTSRWRKA